MAKEKIAIGIDIGSTQIKVAVVQFTETTNPTAKDKNKKIPRMLGTGLAISRGVRRGYIEDPEELSEALSTALRLAEKSSGVRIQSAEISLGESGMNAFMSTGSTMVGRADQEITNLDMSKASESSEESIPAGYIRNRRIIHRIPVGTKIDGSAVFDGKAIGMKGSKLEVKTLFVTSLEPHFANMVKVLEDNDVGILDIVASPIAGSLACLTKSQKMAGCILVNIGASTTSLIVYEDNVPVSLQILPLGGNDITNDIALGLKISIEEAESLKIGAVTNSTVSKKKLDEIIHARLSDIFELIEGHLKKINRNAMLPAGVFLTGGSSKINGIEIFARNALKLPAKIVSIPSGVAGKTIDPLWSTAYGLCLIGSSNDHFEHGNSGDSIGINELRIKLMTWFKQFLP
jgi:cell division protein FtsA